MKHIIYEGDTLERIKEIPDESIHLTITSPPYFNAKKYNNIGNNIGNNIDYDAYLRKILRLITDIWAKTTPGGIVVWNTSPVIDNGKRFGIPFDTNKIFLDCRFELLEDIIWVKPMGAAKLRCGGWYRNKGKPLTWHANINTEYIMVYKKLGERPQGTFKPINTYYPEIPKDLSSNTWVINPETQTRWHDAPFPKELAKRCILLYSFIGDTVLDPFAGSFTVATVCRELERNSISIELSKKYIELGKKKMGFYQTDLFNEVLYEEK